MRGKLITVDDFSGGVNSKAAPYDIAPNQARDARNVQATQGRGVIRRNGSSTLATLPGNARSLFAGTSPNAGDVNQFYMLAATGSTIYSVTPSGTINTIASGIPTASPDLWEWIRAPVIGGQGPFYGMNGSAAYQWTAATASTAAAAWTATAGAVPLGKYVIYHGNRVWAAGVASDPSALFFSNIGDPRDWPAANVVRFNPQDGEDLTGIGIAGPYILVFKKTKVWLVTNLDNGGSRPVSRNIGCIAHRSIAETPRGTLFASENGGVWVANQNNTELLSDNERLSDPVIDKFNLQNRRESAAVVFGDHYYLATQPGTPGLMFDFDLRFGSWWLHSLTPYQMVVVETPSGGNFLYGMMANGRIDQLFASVNTDAGVAFTAYWHGPFHTFGKPAIRKRCREIRVDGSGTTSILVGKDYASAMTSQGTGFTGGDPIEEATVHTPGVARAWSVGFSGTSNFSVEGYAMAMQERTD